MLTVKLNQSDFADPARWQQVARDLELPEGRNHVIVTRIPGLVPVEPGWKIEQEIPQPEEWLWGDSCRKEDGTVRSYIVHTHEPRFIAALKDDSDSLDPPFEYILSDGSKLCNFVWLDPPPEDLTALLNEAEQFINDYDNQLESD